jgi:tRNA(adenine34) deaminase
VIWKTLAQPWQACLEEAWNAYCAGSLPIGAVVYGHDHKIVSRGRNRRYERGNFPFGVLNQEIMHAEIQAILAIDDEQVARHSAELYTSMEPCPMCLGTWYMSNMRVVHFAARDPYAGSTDLLDTTWYMSLKGKQAVFLDLPPLEDLLIGLHYETECRIRGSNLSLVFDQWAPVHSRGIAIGNLMVADKTLQHLRDQSAAIDDAFSYLEAAYLPVTNTKPGVS